MELSCRDAYVVEFLEKNNPDTGCAPMELPLIWQDAREDPAKRASSLPASQTFLLPHQHPVPFPGAKKDLCSEWAVKNVADRLWRTHLRQRYLSTRLYFSCWASSVVRSPYWYRYAPPKDSRSDPFLGGLLRGVLRGLLPQTCSLLHPQATNPNAKQLAAVSAAFPKRLASASG